MEEVRTYKPNSHIGWSPRVWRRIFMEVVNNRELIWRLFLRDFSAKYRQTLLGFLWAVIMPIAMMGTFLILNASEVMNIGEVEVPYLAWGLLGIAIWEIFRVGLVNCSNSIVMGGSMVVKINFPKETLVLASFGQSLVELGVRLFLVVIVFIAYRIVPEWTAIFFPLALIPMMLLTVGLGFLLALLNALLRDVANVVTIGSMFLMFLTPVMYPSKAGLVEIINRFNPLEPLVTGARELVTIGGMTSPHRFAIASAFSVFVFLLSWRLFTLAEVRMAERMGSR